MRSKLIQTGGNVEHLLYWLLLVLFVKRDQGFMKWFSKKTNLQWFPSTNICHSWITLDSLNGIWVSNLLLSNKGRIDCKTISRCITIKNDSQRMQGGKYFSWLLNMVTWRDRLSAGIWEIRKDDRVRLAENCINQKWLIILTRKYRSGKYTSWTSSPLRSFPSRWRAHKVWFVIHKPIRFVAMTTDYRLIQYYLSRRVNNWTCHLLFACFAIADA